MTPDDLKKRYRSLAQQWHPDKHPGDLDAARRMTEINWAFQLLTSMDTSRLAAFAGVRFEEVLRRERVDVAGVPMNITISMEVSERFASDWIYAACFAGQDQSVYLASYGGFLVHVDEHGAPKLAYRTGAVPQRVVDTGRFLYLLTHTRLYVLSGLTLHAMLDDVDGDELVITPNGFGLVGKYRLRWFAANGTPMGTIASKDPLRRIYRAGNQLILETQRHQAHLDAGLSWWG